VRAYEHANGELYRRSLAMCDYQRNEVFLINPVLYKDQAIGFAVKHSAETFNIDVLQKIIRKLQELHDRLEGGA
jgi:hypothetical protein